MQSSTRLWEQLPVPVMDTSLKLHHDTFRQLLPKFNGYESATGGCRATCLYALGSRARAMAGLLKQSARDGFLPCVGGPRASRA